MSAMNLLIGLDWGTSRLRAYLFDACGKVCEARERSWGISCLPEGGFKAALTSITSGWPDCPIIAAGMIGSRNGLRETPYADAPATIRDVANKLVNAEAVSGRPMVIVPGVQMPGGADVMRGEESEVFGALRCNPQLMEASEFLLPGTHSKWVTVSKGAVTQLQTTITGEMFRVLLEHTVLGVKVEQIPAEVIDVSSFDKGVETSGRGSGGDLLHTLFSARTLVLGGWLPISSVPDYLSGLLLGEEWRASIACGRVHDARQLHLIGDPLLCRRYARAASVLGVPEPELLGSTAALGLWSIAQEAQLVSARCIKSSAGVRA